MLALIGRRNPYKLSVLEFDKNWGIPAQLIISLSQASLPLLLSQDVIDAAVATGLPVDYIPAMGRLDFNQQVSIPLI